MFCLFAFTNHQLENDSAALVTCTSLNLENEQLRDELLRVTNRANDLREQQVEEKNAREYADENEELRLEITNLVYPFYPVLRIPRK